MRPGSTGFRALRALPHHPPQRKSASRQGMPWKKTAYQDAQAAQRLNYRTATANSARDLQAPICWTWGFGSAPYP